MGIPRNKELAPTLISVQFLIGLKRPSLSLWCVISKTKLPLEEVLYYLRLYFQTLMYGMYHTLKHITDMNNTKDDWRPGGKKVETGP